MDMNNWGHKIINWIKGEINLGNNKRYKLQQDYQQLKFKVRAGT